MAPPVLIDRPEGNHQEKQCEEMWAGVKMNRCGACTNECESDRNEQIFAPPKQVTQQNSEDSRDDQSGKKHNRLQSGPAKESAVKHVRQPFPRKPGVMRLGKR